MAPTEMLDEVLYLLAIDINLKSPDASAGDIGDVLLAKHPELKHPRFYSDLHRILAKLEKEGYISSHIRQREGQVLTVNDEIITVEHGITHYFTTFDGNLFVSQDGYRGQKAKEKLELEKMKLLESNQMELQKSQLEAMKAQADAAVLQGDLTKKIVRLTIWIAVGTIAAAVYYICQLIFGQAFLFQLFHRHCH